MELDEPQIQSRLYLIEKSFEIIKENPLLGKGIGGFQNYNNDPNLLLLKYPHNIFLELLCEYGVLIGGFFSIGLILLFVKAIKRNFILGIFILYALLIAQTTKDITSQMWFLLALFPLKEKYNRNREA